MSFSPVGWHSLATAKGEVGEIWRGRHVEWRMSEKAERCRYAAYATKILYRCACTIPSQVSLERILYFYHKFFLKFSWNMPPLSSAASFLSRFDSLLLTTFHRADFPFCKLKYTCFLIFWNTNAPQPWMFWFPWPIILHPIRWLTQHFPRCIGPALKTEPATIFFLTNP